MLDKHAPDPEAPHREWRRAFLSDIHAVHRVMRYAAEDVVSKVDGECVDELVRVDKLFREFVDEVLLLRSKSLPDNVTRLRRTS